MNYSFKRLFLFCLTLSFISCGNKAEEPSVSTTTTSEWDGTWKSSCRAKNTTDSVQDTLSFSNGVGTFTTIDYFNTTSCVSTGAGLTVILTTSVTLGGDSSTVLGAKTYQFSITAITAKPETSMVAGNMSGTCGFTNWTAGIAKSVFGCTTWDLNNIVAGTVAYDIYKIDKTVTPNTLQLGTGCSVSGYSSFCTTAATRPTSLDTSAAATLIKQ